ncbi:hypothetical protein B0H12DRAFT_1067881 [Mycena haematopus]|nr:hypothetical protein B0H12DRAFT_1067881 [Mycena haematopus]
MSALPYGSPSSEMNGFIAKTSPFCQYAQITNIVYKKKIKPRGQIIGNPHGQRENYASGPETDDIISTRSTLQNTETKPGVGETDYRVWFRLKRKQSADANQAEPAAISPSASKPTKGSKRRQGREKVSSKRASANPQSATITYPGLEGKIGASRFRNIPSKMVSIDDGMNKQSSDSESNSATDRYIRLAVALVLALIVGQFGSGAGGRRLNSSKKREVRDERGADIIQGKVEGGTVIAVAVDELDIEPPRQTFDDELERRQSSIMKSGTRSQEARRVAVGKTNQRSSNAKVAGRVIVRRITMLDGQVSASVDGVLGRRAS